MCLRRNLLNIVNKCARWAIWTVFPKTFFNPLKNYLAAQRQKRAQSMATPDY